MTIWSLQKKKIKSNLGFWFSVNVSLLWCINNTFRFGDIKDDDRDGDDEFVVVIGEYCCCWWSGRSSSCFTPSPDSIILLSFTASFSSSPSSNEGSISVDGLKLTVLRSLSLEENEAELVVDVSSLDDVERTLWCLGEERTNGNVQCVLKKT